LNRISIAIIAHNEATGIGQTLASVEWADQIVVVDCDSNDATAEIARDAGADVYHEPNRDNLNINKNIAVNHCNGDWVMVLDADETVPDDLAGEIRVVVNEGKHDGYLVPRRNNVLGRGLRHGGQYPDWQLRLFRRGCARFPEEHIHERIKVDGRVGRLKHYFHHYPYRTVDDMTRKGRFYAEFEARYLFNKGVTISSVGLIVKARIFPALRFVRRYVLKGGFLDGVPGLVTAYFDAWNQAVRWLWLWDLQRHESLREETA